MPVLSSLVNRGVMGNLASLEPILSPLIWTSIATGKFPHKHGVLGFVEPDPLGNGVRAVGSTTRQTTAIWNILSNTGLDTHMVGWYASHPAEQINGVCVSERFPLVTSELPEAWPLPEGAISPALLAEKLAEFRVHPKEIEGNMLLPFIPRAAELDQSDPVVAERLNVVAQVLAQTASIQSTATWIMENRPWDFLGVYFRALDDLGHHFMPFHPPRLPGVTEEDVATYQHVMEAACCFHDLMLGRLLQLAGPETTVIVVSDHGFESGAHRPGSVANNKLTMAQWHRPYGILAMAGPGLVKDERIYGCSVLDLAPTILQLFGLPVGQDMDGKVLIHAFEAPPEIVRKPTWEESAGGASQPGPRISPEEEHAVMEQLVELGYMERPDGDLSNLMKLAGDEIAFNRITSLFTAECHIEAESAARALVESNPGERRFRLKLVQVLLGAGKLAEAGIELEAQEKLIGPSAEADRMFANLLMLQGRPEESLQRLEQAERTAPKDLQLQEQIGRVLLSLRRWPEAELRFRRVLGEEPDTPAAYLGLAQALVRQNRDLDAVEAALASVGLLHFFPAGHFQLGAILSKMRFSERAIKAFETGLTMQPGNILAHRYLARLHRHVGNLEQAAYYRERVRALDPAGAAET